MSDEQPIGPFTPPPADEAAVSPPPTPEPSFESDAPRLTPETLEECRALISAIRDELRKLFVGQVTLVEGVLAAILAGGHVLVEGVPGLGKTLLVRGLGRVLGLETNRIQFTPDLMPSDITGSHVFDMAERKFVFRPGPVFTQFLLADEFNRAPAKTHSALLEVMQERQVTLDGQRFPLKAPFLTLATQNPIENEGTYALPEAQLDRFLFKLLLDYPSADEEDQIFGLFLAGRSPDAILAEDVNAVIDAERLVTLQEQVRRVHVDPKMVQYIRRLVRATRDHADLFLGASPRAGIAMLLGARAVALMEGRGFILPDDVLEIALPALRHRVILSPEAEVEGKDADSILSTLIRSVEVPRPGSAPAH